MDQLLERTLAQPKFLTGLLTGFSTLAALLAALLSRTVRTLLHGVAPGDPATLAGMALLIAAAGFIASYAPARRRRSWIPWLL